MLDVCSYCKGQCCDSFAILTDNLRTEFSFSPDLSILAQAYRIKDEVLPLIPYRPLGDGRGWLMRCQNHDRQTGKCKIYTERPQFCRQYLCRWAVETLELVS